jgi:hypothetical protein
MLCASFPPLLTYRTKGHYTFGVPRTCRSVQAWHASKIFGVHWREGACTSINWRAGVCIGVQERALVFMHATSRSGVMSRARLVELAW